MSNQFKIGNLQINRLGFGAMRITGNGVWQDPENKPECIKILQTLKKLNVNFIDTADSYGPFVSEQLIFENLYPYEGLLIATKGGLVRTGPGLGYNTWVPVGRPEYLKQCVLMSLRRLNLKQIDLWQLHRIDPKVPQNEQFDAIAQMQKEGLIKYIGLSEVNLEEIINAQKYFEVKTIQNEYNLINRKSEDVLGYCTKNNIGFIPWFPLAAGNLAKEGTILDKIAVQKNCSYSQIALAWLLKKSQVILPIPGTSKLNHLKSNMEALNVQLSDEEFNLLDELGKKNKN